MKTRELKVIMIISSFYPLIGGAEQQCQRLCHELIKRGVDTCVVTRRKQGLKKFELIDGIPVYRISTWGSDNSLWASLSFTLFSVLWLLKEKLSGHFENKRAIFHAHQAYSPARIAVLAKFSLGGRAITLIAGGGQFGEPLTILQHPLRGLYQWVLSRIDRFIVLSQQISDELTKLGLPRERQVVLPNGVATEKFYSLPEQEKESLRQKLGLPQKIVIAFVGRLDPVKNLPLLLRTYATLCKEDSSQDLVLALLGDGSEREALRTMSKELGIEERVLFLGRREDIHEYLKASDIFVLPSISEGMSNALLEAMACGLAVIATDVGAAPEVLRQGQVGLLIRSGDEAGLTEALKKLINEKSLRTHLGERAQATILESYSLDRVVEQYLKLYAEL